MQRLGASTDGDAELARIHERVIVRRVANGDAVMHRQAKRAQHFAQAGLLAEATSCN